MADVVLGLALLAAGAASLFIGYRALRTVQHNARLLGPPLRESIRALRRSRRGTAWLVFLCLACAAGVAGGVILAIEVQKGKDQYFEQREQR